MLHPQSVHRIVKAVLNDYYKCKIGGDAYDGEGRKSSWMDKRLNMIPAYSVDYQIIGNTMEYGHDLRETTDILNKHIHVD